MLPVVPHEIDSSNPAVLARQIADNIPAPVSAAIIDEDQLPFQFRPGFDRLLELDFFTCSRY